MACSYITPFGLDSKFVGSPFSSGNAVTNAERLGGKGAGLVWMDGLGAPVPPGFVLHTNICTAYFSNKESSMSYAKTNMKPYLAGMKDKFGFMPLVSVRSGARVSMPGMMDTILNVGLDANTYPFWAGKLGAKAAANSYCRLIEMYGSVVKGIDRKEFEGLDLNDRFALYKRKTGNDFPDAQEQLLTSIEAVFSSWNNERAKVFRKLHGFKDSWGTACVIQSMVFGNLNDNSGTGVLFTRHPDTGENKIVGEFLRNAQGEDVVAGIRTPMPLSEMAEWNPEVASQLNKLVSDLEKAKKDVQDVEFTIQDGKLFILQTRNAKRSARAAIRIALDMRKEKLISRLDAIQRVTAEQYDRVHLPIIDPKFKKNPNWTGIPACNGVVTGVVVLTPQAAINCKEPCILVREETCPDDIAGMIAANGVLTMTGGATSHAAVVARSMDKPCVVGLGFTDKHMFESMFKEGDTISIDGATGNVWACEVPVISGEADKLAQEFDTLMFKGSQIIFDHPHKLAAGLDLSGRLLEKPEVLAKEILAQMKMTPKGFVLDVMPDENQRKLYAIFGADFEKNLISQLDALLPALPKVTLLSNAVSSKMESVSKLSTLEQLIATSTTYSFEGEVSPTVAKVKKWLEKDGILEKELNYLARPWRSAFLLK